MVSKRKKPQVAKVSSEIQEQPKSPPKQDKIKEESKPTNAEALIIHNGKMVQELFSSLVWQEIAFPLLQECIAGVSGRFTNGRYYHGRLTNDLSLNTPFLSGYQKALMDFYNHLDDFIVSKKKLEQSKEDEKLEKTASFYNPFMEEADSEN